MTENLPAMIPSDAKSGRLVEVAKYSLHLTSQKHMRHALLHIFFRYRRNAHSLPPGRKYKLQLPMRLDIFPLDVFDHLKLRVEIEQGADTDKDPGDHVNPGSDGPLLD
ncbi:hypothetical protein H257_12722 [Aphanomyces astaci]|uniref:Uncharacterized protein n=1 Tax=Aphanomyces astaci TaxID=112090 RepID=W4FZQ4_APHAT|nr:hypothetical protein H257_12722 [Aphanomyces astaci]ETV72259.1 hypothetical protein H257_12722 [Aphanomyces astaci]|eukprot:XP_009838327.1 hypothetical protein H257_12722 [Aphanomyces astaci]